MEVDVRSLLDELHIDAHSFNFDLRYMPAEVIIQFADKARKLAELAESQARFWRADQEL